MQVFCSKKRRGLISILFECGILCTWVLQVLCQPPVFTPATDCDDVNLPTDFCQMACGKNVNFMCDGDVGAGFFTGFCFCSPDCYTGPVATPPAQLGDNCPLPADMGHVDPGNMQNCENFCQIGCDGAAYSAQICGDATLSMMHMAGAAMICTCACAADPCPATPAPPSPDPTPPPSDTTLMLTGKLQIFLMALKSAYGVVFFGAKFLVAEILVIGLMMLALGFGEILLVIGYIVSLPLTARRRELLLENLS